MMSQQCADVVCARLGHEAPCRTHLEPLPGGEPGLAGDRVEDLARRFAASPQALGRLAYRHGSRAAEVLEQDSSQPPADPAVPGTTPVCHCEPVLEAELRWAIRREGARTLDDLRRRTRLAMGACQGYRCIARAGAILAQELDLGPDQALAQMLDLLQQRHRGKAPALGGVGLAQEELNQARHMLVGALGRLGIRPQASHTRGGGLGGDDG
jgi:glycerol-3-phosphate dehydrogenase